MSSKKRRSDVGQMRKEDYEAMSERCSFEAPIDVAAHFLSASDMANRRTIRASRPVASDGLNPFANVNLGATSSEKEKTISFSFLPASLTKRKADAASFLDNATTTNKAMGESSLSPESQSHMAALIAQDKELTKQMTAADLGSADQTNVTWQFMFYRSELDLKYQKAQDENKSFSANKRQKTVAPAVAAPLPIAAPAATNPVPFSFGTTSATSATNSNSSSAPKASFNFGAPTAAIASESPAAGFSFGAALSSTTPLSSLPPTPGAFSFKSAAPSVETPGECEGDIAPSESNDTPTAGNTTIPDKAEQDEVRKTEDKHWGNVSEFGPISVYHKGDPKDKDSELAKFASGSVVLQVKNDDPKVHRMVMRGSHGLKVVVNMVIKHDMKFYYQTQQTKKGKSFGLISFNGINDQNRGLEIFKMKGTEEVARGLHEKFEELAGKSK